MSDHRSLDELADDYVLGLLDSAESLGTERRLEADPGLREAVGRSRDRFLELDLKAPPAALAPGLWDTIAARLATEEPEAPQAIPAGARPAANENVASGWRFSALAAMAASLVLAAALGWTLMTASEPSVIAILIDEAGEPLVVVEDYGDASARITPLVDFDVPAGRTMQVWTLPSQDLGPVSLGLLPRAETVLLDGPELPAPHADQLYEITVEPSGGSPTGRPTGPILVKGYARVPL